MNDNDHNVLVEEIAAWLQHSDRLNEIDGARWPGLMKNPLWDAANTIRAKFRTGGTMKDDDYEPATGKDQENIRFERNEAGYEQSIFGGNAMDIEKSILEDTYTNSRMIGKTIQGVDTEKLDLGAGHLVRLVLNFHDGTRVAIRAEGDTLVIEANG